MTTPDARPAHRRAADNEVIGHLRLMLDAADTGGAMSIMRGSLGAGDSGASPHYHTTFSEMLYVLSGELEVLGGEHVISLEAGDVLVVPPLLPHAFGATPALGAEYLLVIAPGLDRFGYFRYRAEHRGKPLPEEVQQQFDNHSVASDSWERRGRESRREPRIIGP